MKRPAIPRRRKRERSGIRDEDGPLRCPAHRAWVRGHECLVEGSYCNGDIEAAHIRIGTDGGMSKKPSDNFTVPLCSAHHRKQHHLGEPQFWRDHGYTLERVRDVAARLAAQSPALAKLRAKQRREQ